MTRHPLSPSLTLRKLIEDNLEDLEDAYLAERAIEQLQQGKDRVISSKEFWRALEVA